MSDENAIRNRAYELWQKEGSPEGRDQEFWERARLMLHADTKVPMETPLQARSGEEKAIDDTMAESFPASDPPSFAATTGAANDPKAANAPRTKLRSGNRSR